MRVICVDDEERVMHYTVTLCRELPEVDEAEGFTSAKEALEWLEDHPVDVALLDIEMPEMNGIEMAKEIKAKKPNMLIIFLTGYPEYAMDGYSVYPAGFLLKPIDEERLSDALNHAYLNRPAQAVEHIKIKTFGDFEITVDGKAVEFSRSRAKELLALLVDRAGGGITRKSAFTEMWEDREYDLKMQKYFDVILRSLRQTLKENGISEILEVKGGYMRIRPELVTCDAYQAMRGDDKGVIGFRGTYMRSYSWASMTEGFFDMH
ncbi:MAG: response regulator [Clostridium lundense]|nr:response regulator [Clostridium lundense]